MKVKYCDFCKWDDLRGSYDASKPLEKCPKCEGELYEADSYEDIP